MPQDELNNLVRIGKLKLEPPARAELEGLLRSGSLRLADSRRADISLESRFDLAYNATHALALAALRSEGYRADSRYLVFQCLQHTIGLSNAQWRVLERLDSERKQARERAERQARQEAECGAG